MSNILEQSTTVETSNDVIKMLLKNNKNEIVKLSTEVTAELAKTEANRKTMTDEEIISILLSFLEDKDTDIIFNAIRALGNICYENEEACNIIDKIGINNIILILERDSERDDNSLTTKATGLLVNLFSLHDGLPRTALKNGIITTLEQLFLKYYKHFEENEMLITFLLSVFNHLADYFDEQNITFFQSLCQLIIDIFKMSTNPEISVMCLEILHTHAEKEEIKNLLAREGVCELLFELIEKHRHKVNDEESRSVLKMACDLIVIILTGDYCMHILYDNGKGEVYLNMVTWLDSDDSDLLSTGILAIGNFARKDVHCIQMVKNGVSKTLIVRSKNLVIPQRNKAKVLQEGLVDVMYPMNKIDQPLVVFKLLGTYRIVIDGQESAALALISRVDFLERLVYWCYNSDHLGVRGEVPRLLSWLIKHCHSFKPFENLLSVKGTIKCIVEMISSNHAVMQNEAFYALNLLCIGFSSADSSHNKDVNNVSENTDRMKRLIDELIQADIGKNLNFVINRYDHFNSVNIKEALEKLSTNTNAENISRKIREISNELTK
ncbi:hypothetical protein NQ317_019353 [Molorchus minor]|uniref:Rap1 GTPase-GDP dissociation stimulator 1-B n=1 Tax=Molorchus minor TaxID=1323400 RepID=A0ABQ9J9G2_9CUCU|nr:hypothetical protein NQ317_019353 [Molorchus minor]